MSNRATNLFQPIGTSDQRVSGIESLRGALDLFDNCSEDWNYQYTLDELVAIYKHAMTNTDLPEFPDCWDDSDIDDALGNGRDDGESLDDDTD